MQSELLQQIEHDAAKGKPVPKELNPPEIMLYYMLLGVYTRYQCGRISREEGHELKTQVYAVYKRMAEEYRQFTEICALYQNRIREGYSVGGVTVMKGDEPHEKP